MKTQKFDENIKKKTFKRTEVKSKQNTKTNTKKHHYSTRTNDK